MVCHIAIGFQVLANGLVRMALNRLDRTPEETRRACEGFCASPAAAMVHESYLWPISGPGTNVRFHFGKSLVWYQAHDYRLACK